MLVNLRGKKVKKNDLISLAITLQYATERFRVQRQLLS